MATESPNWVYGSKSSFAAGELTPTIEGRTDLPLYQNGAKKIINWMILPSGGLTRRPGTEFIWAIQGSDEYLASKVRPSKTGKKPESPDEVIIESASGIETSGSSVSVSISSGSEDDLPPIHKEDGLTFVPTAQDPTSRMYCAKKKRDEGGWFFDYGILDEEDEVYCAPEEKPKEKKA